MEEKEELLVRNFLIETLKAARDLSRVNHTLAPGKAEERGFDLPGGGLWTDTTTAMTKSKIEFPRMSDVDIENHSDKLMAELDVRKAEDLLYLTEADWLAIDLPIGLAFLKDRLLRHVMDHGEVPVCNALRSSRRRAARRSRSSGSAISTMPTQRAAVTPPTAWQSSVRHSRREASSAKSRRPVKAGDGWWRTASSLGSWTSESTALIPRSSRRPLESRPSPEADPCLTSMDGRAGGPTPPRMWGLLEKR